MQRILFVCLGNICRSPMAEFLLRDMLAQQGLVARISVDSAGTSGWHDGEDMHVGTAKILTDLGIDHTGFHSSKVQA
ncbi:MAG TPA: low molecular weight phosphotyrosine protein phosphatase, partial [Vitreoscilla sp.]|nr:low molecular weight phosphotyrosine protein phosphatase [Vitreoscilla sp.]